MPKFIDITGQKFNFLTVLQRTHRYVFPSGDTEWMWDCKCDCGNIVNVRASVLKCGDKQSCGCKTSENRARAGGLAATTHGMSRVGKRARIYRIWCAMKTRCNNPNVWNYKYYGSRGIRVCDRWSCSFENFYADMGLPPEGMSIDRIDPDGDYSPENCRWADQKTQRQNTSKNKSSLSKTGSVSRRVCGR